MDVIYSFWNICKKKNAKKENVSLYPDVSFEEGLQEGRTQIYFE